ncbi:hypothetical protein [Rugosimonospora acidiphila]|uniref:hypothetical protein n=1 Tax=Rugosimonospora acidiphila TaxID=556531 RepID=UPI0031E65659
MRDDDWGLEYERNPDVRPPGPYLGQDDWAPDDRAPNDRAPGNWASGGAAPDIAGQPGTGAPVPGSGGPPPGPQFGQDDWASGDTASGDTAFGDTAFGDRDRRYAAAPFAAGSGGGSPRDAATGPLTEYRAGWWRRLMAALRRPRPRS